MKTINEFKIVAILLIALVFNACVQDDDFSTPVIEENTVELTSNITFQLLTEMYTGTLVNIEDENPGLILEAYVVSSDQSGNIYKNIFIQDAPENPNYGLRLDVDMTDTYLRYDVGRKVYIKLDGLAITESFGTLALGVANGTNLERIPELQVTDHILRSSEVATIVPKVVSIQDIQNDNVSNSMLIQLDNVQVPVGDLGLAFANPDNTFSVNRTLVSCDDNSTVVMRNSGFSDFKSQLMPQLKGSVVAVLGQYNSTKQLTVRSPEDFNFVENRCDPLFYEDFANLNVWENISVVGSQTWGIDDFNDPEFVARISGFSSGPQNNEDWLISPAIDLTSATMPILTFQTDVRYGGPDLEVYYSTDYDESGDPANGNWTALNPTLDTNSNSWSSWVDSGDLDLSAAIGGNVYIAFKYVSDTSSGAATWQVDKVQVAEQ